MLGRKLDSNCGSSSMMHILSSIDFQTFSDLVGHGDLKPGKVKSEGVPFFSF